MQPFALAPDTNTSIFRDFLTPWLYVRYATVNKAWRDKVEALAYTCLHAHNLPINPGQTAVRTLQGIIHINTTRFIEAVKENRLPIAIHLLQSGTMRLDAKQEGLSLFDWSINNDTSFSLAAAFYKAGGQLESITVNSNRLVVRKKLLPHLPVNSAFALLYSPIEKELFGQTEIFGFFERFVKKGKN